MAHIHSIYDTDPHFVIDPKTRKIKNDSGKVILIQGDHNSERFTFEIPRYVDGHDMSLCDVVEIHYDNAGSTDEEIYSDVEEVGDLQISPASNDVVIFSWLISGNATQYKGTLNFAISFQCHDGEGNIEYELGTLTSDDITIGGRLRNSKSVVERVADILSKWRNDLFGIGKTEEAKMRAVSQEEQDSIAAKGAEVLATIPADYAATSAMAEEAIRTKADGIVLSAEGESVVVNDSSNNHIHGLRVFGRSTQKSTTGKNLWNPVEQNNIQVGTVRHAFTVKPNTSYTLGVSRDSVTGLYASVNEDMTEFFAVNYGRNSLTFNSGNNTMLYVQVYSSSNAFTDSDLFYFNEGDSLIEEPYTGGKASPNPEYPQEIVSVEKPKISIHRKNLVRTDYGKTDTYEGMTVVITKGLSEVFLNGKTTKPYGYAISQGTYLVPGRYTLSVYGLNDVDKAYLMNMDTRLTVCDNVRTGSPVTFDVTSAGIYRIDFTFAKETTYTNATVKFQIEAGEIATEYEPIVPFETVTLNHTLPAIPVPSGGNYTDSDGQQWICDEVDFERGKYIQRVMIEELSKASGFNDQGLYCPLYNGRAKYDVRNLCTHVNSKKVVFANGKTGEYASCLLYKEALPTYVVDVSTGQAWLDELKNSGAPCAVAYILSTPVEMPLSESELTVFRALKTNKPTTTVLNDSGAHIQLDYIADTKTYIDNQIAKQIAKITNT